MGKHLESVYGKHGIAMIVDEGGMGIQGLYGTEFAKPGMAEKGYMVSRLKPDCDWSRLITALYRTLTFEWTLRAASEWDIVQAHWGMSS
jgi:hypothetical protein